MQDQSLSAVRRRRRRLEVLLKESSYSSQAEIAEALQTAGYPSVTQATVSRDLRAISAARVNGRWLPGVGEPGDEGTAELLTTIVEWCMEVSVVGHLVLLRTGSGAAQHLAARIDAVHPASLVGSIAGDDTILLVTRPPDLAPAASALALLQDLGLAEND